MYLIKLWYALNSNEKVVKIEDAKKGEEYFCPCCGAEVFPRALNSEKIRPHFYHKKGESCTEAEIHKWIKKDLFKVGQTIKVNTCKGIKEYTIKDILIEKSYKTSVGDYRPDISLVTTDGSVIFVEVCNTNKKSIERYFDKWFELGNTVIEIKAKEVIENNFNLDILEPIYDDDDRFRHFEESDYKKLFGTQVTNREKIKEIYKDIYDYIKGKISIDKIFRKYVYCKCYINEYVCKTVVDYIINDITKYEETLKEDKKYEEIMKECFDKSLDNFGFSNEENKKIDILGVYCGSKSYRTYHLGYGNYAHSYTHYFYSNNCILEWDTNSDLYIRNGSLVRIKGNKRGILVNDRLGLSRCNIEVIDKGYSKYIGKIGTSAPCIRECKDCGKQFILTIDEAEWYNNKNLVLPKRCKCCRDKNKKNN